jgi:hypothetical protein
MRLAITTYKRTAGRNITIKRNSLCVTMDPLSSMPVR